MEEKYVNDNDTANTNFNENQGDDISWSMKMDDRTPKHFIKFIGRSVTANDNLELLEMTSPPCQISFDPVEPLRVIHEKKRFQLGVEDRFLKMKSQEGSTSKPPEEQSNQEPEKDAGPGLEEGSKEDLPHSVEKESNPSKTTVEEAESSDLSESNSELSSDLSRSVIGLIQRAMAAPKFKKDLLSEMAGSERDLTGLDLSPAEKLKMQKARSTQPPEEVFGPRDKIPPEMFVQKTIEQNGIVIFGFSKCAFCARLQYILEMHERTYTMLRLDKMRDYGKLVNKYLNDNWSELNAPNVYFHGKHFDLKYIDNEIVQLAGDLSGFKKDLVSFDPSLYDLIIIGGGPDGCAAAIRAAELKKKVCLIDCIDVSRNRPFWVLGKTGLNIGSVPKRYLFQAALDCTDLHDSKYYGWNRQNFCLKWSFLVRDIWRELKRTNWEYRVNLRKAGVTYLNCETVLVDKHTLDVFNQEMKKFTLKSRYILLTLGAQAYIPKIPGAEYCITSDEIFLQQRIPGKVLIFGGSTVGVEYAFILRQLGFPVTLMVPGTLMRTIDREIVDEVLKIMELLNVEVIRECLIVRVEAIKPPEDMGKTGGKQNEKPPYLLKTQLVDFSDDYIHLWKSDNESASEVGAKTQDEDEEGKSDEVQIDGSKKNASLEERKLFNDIVTNSINCAPEFSSSVKEKCTKRYRDKVLAKTETTELIGNLVKGDGRNNLSSNKKRSNKTRICVTSKENLLGNKSMELPSFGSLYKNFCDLDSRKKEIRRKTFREKHSEKKRGFKLQFRRFLLGRELNSNENSEIKKKSIFATNCVLYGKRKKIYGQKQPFLKNARMLKLMVKSICKKKKKNRASRYTKNVSIINIFKKGKDRTSKDRINNNKFFEEVCHEFDGPKKKGKEKKGKKPAKGRRKPKKPPPPPKETESQKALREKNENLLKLLTKVIATKKVASSEFVFPRQTCKEATYEGQPNFTVVGLFGNGTIHKGAYNTVVIAAGEETTAGNLGLSKVGINLNPGTGKIYTNNNDQTSVDNIFAVGDMVEGKAFGSPAAVCAASYLVQRLFAKSKQRMDYSAVSGLLFLPPSEYSFVGLSEERARETLAGEIHVYKKWFRPLDSIFSHRNTARSFIKVISHVEKPQLEKVVGIHIFGRNAGYTVQGFTLAMKKGLYVHDLEKLIATDFTNAEKLTNIELQGENRVIEPPERTNVETRPVWDEELKGLQSVLSSTQEPAVVEEGEAPSEILIALIRSESEIRVEKEVEEAFGEESVQMPKLKPDFPVRFLLHVSGDKRLMGPGEIPRKETRVSSITSH